MPSTLSPRLKWCGATKPTSVIHPTRCNAVMTANMAPSRSHSRAVSVDRSLAHRETGRSWVAVATMWVLSAADTPSGTLDRDGPSSECDERTDANDGHV